MQPVLVAVRWITVLVWVALLGVAMQRAWWNSEARIEPGPTVSAVAASGEEEWLGVYRGRQKVGYTQQAVAADGDGYRFSQTSLLRLSLLDTPQTVHVRAQGTTDRDWGLRTMTFELASGPGTLRVDARVVEHALEAEVRVGGETTRHAIPLAGPVYLVPMARSLIGGERPVPGRVIEVSVFDPMVLGSERLRLVVEGEGDVPGVARAGRGWRVREEFRGMQSTVWLDAAGKVLREEGPMGLIAVREDPQRAVSDGWGEGALLDLIGEVSIPVGGIDHPRTRSELRLRLSGIRADRVPSDGVQHWDGTMVTIVPPKANEIGTYALPYGGKEHAAALASEPMLQVDHPRVRAAASVARGGVTDARKAVRQLNEWVYGTLRKTPTVTIPNALQVLEMGAGDCNEHAVLLAAMARASGIPTRLVAGVVYVDGAFLYHAWCEAWLGRWVPVDPALGQFPADATHIKFVAGGPEEQFAMVDVIGRLRIEVVDAGGSP